MKTSLKEYVKFHRVAIVCAVLASIIVSFPQVYFRIDHAELYQKGVEGIELLPDSKWSARVREVQDGHPNWGSIYYKDGKDDPYLFQPLGSMVVAYTGSLFNLEINNTILLSRIVYSFIAFLLIYIFAFLLSRDKWVSLSATSAILFADAIMNPSGLRYLLSGEMLHGFSPTNFLEFSKPVNSGMIFIFLFSFLIAFWLYYRKRQWQWGALSAVLLGLNFYNYFYSWTFMFAFGGVLSLIFVFQKQWEEVRRIVYVFLGGLVVAIPYIWNLYSATLHPTYNEVALRHGVLTSHTPQFIGVVALGALIVFLVGFPRDDKKKYMFSLALLLTPFVTLNQQIITGKMLQSSHYHWYTHKPLAVIFVAITFFSLLNLWKIEYRYKRLIAICAILTSFAIGFCIQGLSYEHNSRDGFDGGSVAVERQKYAPAMHWLNQHAQKESVVFGNEETSHMVVIYTPLNVFHELSDQLMLSATDARLQDVIFTFYRLRDVGHGDVEEIFRDELLFLSSRLFGIHYREKNGGDNYTDIPDYVFNALVARYEKTLETPTPEWLHDVWKKYEVEYLVWDTKVDSSWNLEQYSFLKEVATFGDIKIFEFADDVSAL